MEADLRVAGIGAPAESSGVHPQSGLTDPAAAGVRVDGAQKAQPSAAMPLRSMVAYQLKFELDAETREVTIFVVDKSTKEVVRTIPPEALAKLNAGDLLEILV